MKQRARKYLFFHLLSVNIEEAELRKRKQNVLQEREDAQQSKEKGAKKATDDYHYDKFKKQYRR